MPLMLLGKIGIVGICLWAVKVNPQKLPRVIFAADVGIFIATVQKKAVAGLGRDCGQGGGRSLGVGYLTAAGEHDQEQIGIQTATAAQMGLETL